MKSTWLWILCASALVIESTSVRCSAEEPKALTSMLEAVSGSTSVQEILTYDAAYYAGGRSAVDGKYGACIDLRDSSGNIIASARFHRLASTLPATDSRSASGYIVLNYPLQAYPQVLDLLRNEKPVVLWFDGTRKIGGIVCRQEPVGEQESR